MAKQKDQPAAGSDQARADAQPPSFEASAERLGAIVQQLESGELPLEKSLELFEEGVRVARQAQARLDEAEKRVDELLGVDAEGQARTRPFQE
jgi:exodeoxyribonuclease VII small subunit